MTPRTIATTLAGLLVVVASACTGGPSEGSASSTGDPTGGSASTGESTGESTGAPACAPGAIVCDGATAHACGPEGEPADPEVCAGVCVDGLGCVACQPGALVCDGDDVKRCGDDGEPGDVVTSCDPVQGLACAGGECVGACAPDPDRPAEVGCEFWASPLPDIYGDVLEPYGLGLTNTCDHPTKVEIWVGGVALQTVEVPAGASLYQGLLRLPNLIYFKSSLVATNGSYHVRSDCPIAVVQLLDTAATGDASRLYPTESWGAASIATSFGQSDFEDPKPHPYLVVIPRDDATTVTVDSAPGVVAVPVAGIGADGDGEVVLDRGEFLLLGFLGDPYAVSVTADGPIEVFSGHECANVPLDVLYCDHLEEVAPPTASLGTEYVVVPPLAKELNGERRPHIVRVIATGDPAGVTISEPGLGAQIEGSVITYEPTDKPLVIAADAPVQVAQYFLGHGSFQSPDPSTGEDPSLLIPPPISQWRREHRVWAPEGSAPEGWAPNVVEVLAPTGAAATVDGEPVTGWAPIGAGLSAAAVVVAPGGHVVAADSPIGVSVYGFDASLDARSYGYAGAWSRPE